MMIRTIKRRKRDIKCSIELLDKVIEEGAISDTNLRLLINEIVVLEENEKIQIVVSIKAPFDTYGEVYKNGKTVLKHRGDYESITA